MINLWDILTPFTDVTTILLTLVFLLVIGYVISMQERSGIPPGPPYWPIVGNMLDMRGKRVGKRHKYYAELQEKYGDIFRIYFGNQLLVVLNDFESIEEAFVKQKDLFSSRPVDKLWGIQQAVKDGKGVLWASGQEWKEERRMTVRALRDLGVGKTTLEDRIKEEAKIILGYVTAHEGKPFIVHDLMMKATTNIVSTVVFGKRYDYSDPDFLQIIKVLQINFKGEMTFFSPIHQFPMLRFIPVLAAKILTARNSIEKVKQFIVERIEEHKEVFDKSDIKDFIDVHLDMCANGASDVTSEGNTKRTILSLFAAGSDTTATTLDWTLLYMILHTEVQKKCQEEIDSVVGDSRMVGWSDKSKMPYNEATLLEVQRIANAVPTTAPHTTDKDAVVKGFLIPQGSLVYGNLYACHLDSRYWKEPLQFKPERFLDGSGTISKQTAATLIPFSTGPRICVGESLARMEIFLFFTNLLQRFSFSTSGSEKPSTDGICGLSMSTPEYTLTATPR
ncbi:cytochrome P450 2D3 [Patella vulgata]|uniref:cytochrome P450 2D3 n=1 Tax=Patella vulgata TaxID=6465 RepID=UPI0021808A93|nr:cytochrome P450 2D3 [Patella vulgata]